MASSEKQEMSGFINYFAHLGQLKVSLKNKS